MRSSIYLYGKIKKSWATINPVLQDKIEESEILIRHLQTLPNQHPKWGHIAYPSGLLSKWWFPERDWVRINKSLDAQRHCRKLITEPKERI